MHPYVNKNAYAQFTAAFRANDLVEQMRIITENLGRSEGEERAFWLQRRAICRMQIAGVNPYEGENKRDMDEAIRLVPQNLEGLLVPYFSRTFSSQQVAPLREIPQELRVRFRREGIRHRFSMWHMAADFHWLRRRWYQAFRAYSKAIDQLTAVPEEERRRFGGWYYVYYAGRARSALRCGRHDLAPGDVQRAEAMTETGKHLHPWYLAMAKGELALHRGAYAEALEAIHACLARLSEIPAMRLSDTNQIELDLLAARIARAQGNQVGFESFCEKALALSVEKRLPMSEEHVRAIMAGAPY